ncbi:MAG: PAS domain-containing protein [Leptolyngbyaceae bacterium]|nr:PAS domain-containing protein [Leptolyngbyaceae bacterium]
MKSPMGDRPSVMTPSIRRLLAKAPLKLILIVPFVVQLSLAAGLIGWLSIRNGRQAVDTVTDELWDEISARTVQHITEYTTVPQDVVAETVATTALNLANLRDPAILARYLWHQMNTHEGLYTVAVGYETGEVVGVGIEEEGQLVIRAMEPGQTQLRTYAVVGEGDRGELIRADDFDLRTRPWYRDAVEAGTLTWTDIYPFYSPSFNIISAVHPIYDDETGQLVGVANATLSLWQISDFLEKLEVGQTGEIFIIDRTGNFVATSTEEPLERTDIIDGIETRQRLNAGASLNEMVRAAANHLMQHFDSLEQIQQAERTDFVLNGKRTIVQVTPFSDDLGLDWLIVVAVPESDFMEQVETGTRTTFFLCLGALVLAIGSGVATAHWLTGPILQLNRAAKEIAEGNLQQHTFRETLATDRSRELGELATSFIQMTQQLQTSFAALQSSETDFRNMAASVPGAIIRYVLHPDGSDTVSYMSPGCYELWEIEEEVVADNPGVLWQVVHSEDVSAMQASVAESARTLERWYHEWRITTPSGQVKWLEGRGTPMQQPNGDIVWGTVILDVSDRKHAELQLQDVSNRLELAVRSAKIGVWDWDIVNNHVLWDDRMCELYSINRTEFEITYNAWKTRLHPEDVQRCAAAVQQALAGEQDYDIEFRVVWPNGSIHHLDAYGLIQRDAEGQPIRMIGVNLDITERTEAEADRIQKEKLQLELVLLETMLDSVLAGYWDWDIPNHREYMSSGLKRMLGYEDDELPNVPESWQGLIFADDLPGVMDCFDRHVQSRGEEPYYNEVRYHHKNGSIIWVICAGKVIDWDPSGQPLRMVGCHVDITRLKQTEEQLQQSDVHLKQAQRIAKLGSWEFEVQKAKITWSDEVFRIFGRDPALGTPATFEELQSFFHLDDRPLHQQTVEEAIATAHPYDVECRIYRPDGTLVHIQAKGEPILDATGQVIQLTGTVLDITERKHAEERLLRTTAQLKASNRELEAFAYSVSHDLRSPLRAIDGFSKALLEDYGTQFGDEGRDYFDRIRHNVKRMGVLIDDLLSLSRISRSEMRYQAINLSDLVWEHAAELQRSDPERQVEFVIAPDVVVSGDRTLINAVISNLMSNAWKFTRHHATARIEFGILKEHRENVYFIRDDGAGFKMDYVSKLFDVFQRLHSTQDFPGTGIGLAIVQRAIHRHGGDIWAEAEVEKGATLYFTLPTISAASPN